MVEGELLSLVWGALGVTMRAFGALRVQPLWRVLAGAHWSWISLVLSLALSSLSLPSAGTTAVSSWSGVGLWLLFEFGIGTAFGLWAALPAYAAMGAGEVSSVGLGLGAASSAGRHLWIALTLFFAVGTTSHHAALESFAASLELWPPFDPTALSRAFVSPIDLVLRLAATIHAATVLGLALATPVLLTRLVLGVGLESLFRPHLPPLSGISRLREALLCAASLVALGAAWSTFPGAWSEALG